MKKFNELSQEEKVKFLQESVKESAKYSGYVYSGIFFVVIIALLLGSL